MHAGGPVRVFICYAREDAAYRDELLAHLRHLEHAGLASIWSDERIEAGLPWDEVIRDELRSADLAVFLVSPDSIASEYIRGVEASVALERYAAGELRIVPVRVRPTEWAASPLSTLQSLPRDGSTVSEATNQDRVWRSVAMEIQSAIEVLREPVPPGARGARWAWGVAAVLALLTAVGALAWALSRQVGGEAPAAPAPATTLLAVGPCVCTADGARRPGCFIGGTGGAARSIRFHGDGHGRDGTVHQITGRLEPSGEHCVAGALSRTFGTDHERPTEHVAGRLELCRTGSRWQGTWREQRHMRFVLTVGAGGQ